MWALVLHSLQSVLTFDTCCWNMSVDLLTTMKYHTEVIRICKQINISREIQTKQI